tara:strand:- start:147 stop:335 length:189 start_codon:yes stop_codon:yes gene_type:complete
MKRLQIVFTAKDFVSGSEWLEENSKKIGFSYNTYHDVFDTEEVLSEIEKALELSGLEYYLGN